MSTGGISFKCWALDGMQSQPFYVMEYFENGSIEDLVRARGALGVTEAGRAVSRDRGRIELRARERGCFTAI